MKEYDLRKFRQTRGCECVCWIGCRGGVLEAVLYQSCVIKILYERIVLIDNVIVSIAGGYRSRFNKRKSEIDTLLINSAPLDNRGRLMQQ